MNEVSDYALTVKETIEREIKLVAGEGFTLPELGGEPRPTRVFVSTYHDTAGLTLARHRVTFRHRVEDGAGVWQLKLPRSGDVRIELERGGPPAVPPAELTALLPALLRNDPLVPVARLRTRREVVLAGGAEIVDDSVAVLDHQHVTRRFREIEVELLDGDEQTLRRFETALRAAGANGEAFTPKLYRALDLTYPRAPEVPADASPTAALALRLHEQATALVAHDPGTRLGSHPEDLHQLRVATRRLRAYLRVARPLLVLKPARALRDELAWLGAALGPVRDLDVLLDHFARALEALDGDADRASGLLAALGTRREEARAALLERLVSDRYFALLDTLAAFTAEPPVSGEDTALSRIWWHEAKRLRRAAEALGDDPGDAELHEVRIFVKRSRYAAELAAHELGKRGARFVTCAKNAQDILGAHQDAVVGEREIVAWAGNRDEVASVAEQLVEGERARRVEARAVWPQTWAQLWNAAQSAKP